MKKIFLAVLLAWPLAVNAANVNIDGLPAASAVGTGDLFECEQSSVNNKCTSDQLKTWTQTSAVDARTTTTEAIANSDQGKLVTFNNASAVACTIAQAGAGGNFGAGWAASLKNLGAGTVTCTPTTSTIDGAATVTLTTGQGLDLYSDGTNYFTQGGKGSSSASGANPTATASDTAVNGSATTFMRSDAAPAVQKGSNSQFGVVEGDNLTVSAAAGVLSTKNVNHPGYKASLWYVPMPGYISTTTSAAPVAATAYCTIGQIAGPSSATITALGIRNVTAGTSNTQLAIYNDNASGSIHRPGTLIDSTASIANTAGNSTLTASLNATHSVNPGFYWFCIQVNDTTNRYTTVSSTGVTNLMALVGNSSAAVASVVNVSGVSTTTGVTSFGTWPDFTSATFTELNSNLAPMLVFQFSSVP